MTAELHIRLHVDVIDAPDVILGDFPFEPGQAILSYMSDLVVVDLGEFDDTNPIQDWFLNSLDEVMSFYVVGE
jgi:hypothetical protein